MSQIISPYALLQASKPAPKIVTTYDLYSAVQSASPASFPASFPAPAAPPSPQAQDASNPRRQEPPVQEAQQTAARMPLVPAKRTHYIADIKNRHNAALRRTLPNQRPPMA